MGRLYDDNYERAPLLGRPVKSTTRGFVRRVMLFLAALAISVIFIAVTINSSATDSDEDGNQDSRLNPLRMDPDIELENSQPHCPSATNVLWTSNVPVDFKGRRSFHISQVTDKGKYHSEVVHVRTVGAILIRRLPDDTPYKNGYITTEVRASNPDIQVRMNMNEEISFIRIEAPTWIPRSLNTGGDPCISIEVTLWIPDNASIADLRLEAVSLNVRKYPEVMAHVIGNTNIKIVSGSIHFYPSKDQTEKQALATVLPKQPSKSWWLTNIPFLDRPSEEAKGPTEASPSPMLRIDDPPAYSLLESSRIFVSRRQNIETVSGTIRGTFTLFDYLNVTTKSGSVHIDVLPQDEDLDVPAPAELYLQCTSGTAEAHFPFNHEDSSSSSSAIITSKIPVREYRTYVNTASGSIRGNFLLGSHASFKTVSGSIRLAMLYGNTKTISSTDEQVRFSTEVTSGSTSVHILNPEALSPIRNLSSNHSTRSGSVRLAYPSEWEGSIHVTSMSGSLSVSGKGVVIDRFEKARVKQELTAHKGPRKGPGGSSLQVNDMSGSVQIVVGRD